MNGNFQPVSRERAEQIRQALSSARDTRQGLAIDRQTGQVVGAAPLSDADQDKVNMIGKFDTHYG